MTDLAVVGMDPGFGGGVRGQTEAFWRAALDLGREPALHYLAHPSLSAVSRAGSPLDLPGRRAPFGRIDAANLLAAPRLLGPGLRNARSLWVVATTAPYGYAAARSGRRYACWLGAGVREESSARRPGLPPSRQLALRLNGPVLRRLERTVIREAAAVYATGPSSRAEIARVGLPVARIGILPIPVDFGLFRPSPDQEWLAGLERPVLVFVGRADDPRKNAGLLLEAFPQIRAQIPAARLRLIGTPPSEPLPEGVEATGPVSSVAEQLRDASIFVLPSLHEGFGMAVAEALAAGVPVVTTPSGGTDALVHASGGGLVLDGFSPQELAAAVTGLLDDVASLSRMRRSGREYVEREHSPARFRELLGQAFRRLDQA